MPYNSLPLLRTNIIVADDHPVVALGISKMLDNVPNLNLIATASTIAELFRALEQLPCDLLICDYSFEDDSEPDGMLLLERIIRHYPNLPIILLTSHNDLVIFQRTMKLGIAGFLSKVSRDFSALPEVISRVLRGERYVDPGTSKILVQSMINTNFHDPALSIAVLTSREFEVVRMFSKGMSVTDIAQHTNRSIKTISTQKKQAMIKLGVCNDVELLNTLNQLL